MRCLIIFIVCMPCLGRLDTIDIVLHLLAPSAWTIAKLLLSILFCWRKVEKLVGLSYPFAESVYAKIKMTSIETSASREHQSAEKNKESVRKWTSHSEKMEFKFVSINQYPNPLICIFRSICETLCELCLQRIQLVNFDAAISFWEIESAAIM